MSMRESGISSRPAAKLHRLLGRTDKTRITPSDSLNSSIQQISGATS